jgi:hypothetical protein
MRCPTCKKSHSIGEPAFRRPDVIAALPIAGRFDLATESDDLCVLRGLDEPHRYFVRGLVFVRLTDVDDDICWGLWAEVAENSFRRIRGLWDDPRQHLEPPLPAVLANRVPGYPDTLGLAVLIQLTSPTSRPQFLFAADSEHPFARECLAGVTMHRASQWGSEARIR